MPFEEGDVIEFDYELWVEGQDKLSDTTLRDAAERSGIFEANAFYAPMTYIVGSGRIIPGLEKALKDAEVGKTFEVTLPPEEAYGPRRPELVETLPIQEFKKSELDPHVGMQITRQNRRGVISTVGGGRVRVDFNPGLAGKTLRYRVTVRKRAETDTERVSGLIRMHFPAKLDWKVEASPASGQKDAPKAVRVTVPEAALYHQNWLPAKVRVVMDTRRYTTLDEVLFVEAYRLRPEEGDAAPGATEVAPSQAD